MVRPTIENKRMLTCRSSPGKKVQIRFEYITDAAVNGEGFLLDDVRVDAAGYTSDFEADDGWTAAGFARVQNVLPQTFRLSLIVKGDTTTVTQIPVNADQTAEFPFSLKPGEEAILIVTGTTRYTRLTALAISGCSRQVKIKIFTPCVNNGYCAQIRNPAHGGPCRL